MKWWRADLDQAGAVLNVEALPGPPNDGIVGTVVFQAEDHETALKWARQYGLRAYCAQKKRESRQRLYVEGLCTGCARPRDRKCKKTGRWLTRCRVCTEGIERARANARSGQTPKVRDEAARVEKYRERHRDRRREIRRETLLEVSEQFWALATVREFAAWLEQQIEKTHVGDILADRGAADRVDVGDVPVSRQRVDRCDPVQAAETLT